MIRLMVLGPKSEKHPTNGFLYTSIKPRINRFNLDTKYSYYHLAGREVEEEVTEGPGGSPDQVTIVCVEEPEEGLPDLRVQQVRPELLDRPGERV